MTEVTVELGTRAYPIRIADTFQEALGPVQAGKVLLVSDANVAPFHAERVGAILRSRGCEVATTVIPAGEASKSLAMLETVCREASRSRLDRGDCIAALGGGVVGDLAGFAAASYLRGVSFVQIPTSLLAMVDSSVGGKTGVNLPEGKNLVGAFYQPQQVAIGLESLESLPAREYVSGLAEVVKHGIIRDHTFVAYLERNCGALLARDRSVVADVVARNCSLKAEIVAMDEREGGARALLNFGHTLGHAVEAACGYGTLLHGEAVSIGAVAAVHISVSQGRLTAADGERMVSLLANMGLPIRVPVDHPLTWDAIAPLMMADKKVRNGQIKWVLADGIGQASFGCLVSEALARAAAASVGVEG